MACGGPFRLESPSAAPMQNRNRLLIPNTSFTIRAPIHELNSGSIAPWSGQEKFDISKSSAGVRDLRRRNHRGARARSEKIFQARFGTRDLTSVCARQPARRVAERLFTQCRHSAWAQPIHNGGTQRRRAVGDFFLHPLSGPIFREQFDGEWETAGDYARWIRCYDRLEREDVQRIRKQIAKFHYLPMISILLPAYNSNLRWLRRAILSVQKQRTPQLGALRRRRRLD